MLREAGAARWFIAGVVAFALLGTFGTLLFAFELSAFIARAQFANLWLAFLGAVIKAVTVFGQEWLAAKAAVRVKQQLRRRLLDRVFSAPSAWREAQSSDELTWLLSSGLDALDAYFAKFVPQLIYTAIAMPIFVITALTQDALSALLIVLTMPLVPLFMVFIGWATAKVQQRQLDAMTGLSRYFGEVIRGLLTLRVFNRAEHQAENLVRLSKDHRSKTMKVLSVSFLSGFALELIASLSVALVAVSIGLRLIDGAIDYRAGLFVLLLAPDAYLPLRMIGANFHASSEGIATIRKTFALLDAPVAAQNARAVKVKPGRFTVFVGESGTGKSTALEALIGPDAAWLPQGTAILPGTVQQNIVGFGAWDQGALDSAIENACLDDVDPGLELGQLNNALSGGQAQRVGLARAIYRVASGGASVLLLDEPLSAQDPARGNQIAKNLKVLTRSGVTVVAVSHQDALHKSADERIEFAQ